MEVALLLFSRRSGDLRARERSFVAVDVSAHKDRLPAERAPGEQNNVALRTRGGERGRSVQDLARNLDRSRAASVGDTVEFCWKSGSRVFGISVFSRQRLREEVTRFNREDAFDSSTVLVYL